MIDKLSKYLSWLLYALMAVSVVLAAMFYFSSIEETLLVSILMRWAYILLVATALVSISHPYFGFIMQPKNAIKLLINLGIVAVIAIIAFSLAGNTFSDARVWQGLGITAETSRLVGLGLLFTYITGPLPYLPLFFRVSFKIL
jgi:hypothetical protein